MPDYEPYWYNSEDGLKLFARVYRHGQAPFTLLCMHGLTRNSADFEGLIDAVGNDYPILAVDQRGRGLSDHDPLPSRYQVPVYATDMFTLLESKGVRDTVLIGTSMGGLIAMQMLAMRPDIIRGVALNDIGAVIEGNGLARIQGYVGKNMAPVKNWVEAADRARQINESAFPEYTEEDWLRFARRQYRENEDGLLQLAYDPAIAQSAPATGQKISPVEMWPLFDSLPNVPMLFIRGALSDILSRECLQEMVARKPGSRAVEIPGRGHAPALDEPEAVEAIRDFLQNLKN